MTAGAGALNPATFAGVSVDRWKQVGVGALTFSGQCAEVAGNLAIGFAQSKTGLATAGALLKAADLLLAITDFAVKLVSIPIKAANFAVTVVRGLSYLVDAPLLIAQGILKGLSHIPGLEPLEGAANMFKEVRKDWAAIRKAVKGTQEDIIGAIDKTHQTIRTARDGITDIRADLRHQRKQTKGWLFSLQVGQAVGMNGGTLSASGKQFKAPSNPGTASSLKTAVTMPFRRKH